MLPEDEVGSIIYDVRIAAIYLQRTLSASGCVCSTRGLVWIVLSKAIVPPFSQVFSEWALEPFSDLIDRANG